MLINCQLMDDQGYQSALAYLPTFLVKCVRFFVSTEPEFPKIYRWLPKIAEMFGRLLKIAEDF